MGEAKRKKPAPMPTAQAVAESGGALTTRFFTCGSRDIRRVRDPDPDLLAAYSIVNGDLAVCQGRRAIVFVHGYNVTAKESERS